MTGSRHSSRGSSLATVLAWSPWDKGGAHGRLLVVRGRKEHGVMATLMIPTLARSLPTQTD
jgi:hypothetical protein